MTKQKQKYTQEPNLRTMKLIIFDQFVILPTFSKWRVVKISIDD